MFTRAILSFGLLAAAQQALAQPACLLAAVNKTGHPSDQKRLCCSEADTVKQYLSDLCHDNAEDAVSAFEAACKEANYGSCSSSSSQASSGLTSASSLATGAPFPVVYTTTYFDEACSCTKSKAVSSTVVPGSTGLVSGTFPTATGSSNGSSSSSSSDSGASSGSNSGSNSGANAGSNPGSIAGAGNGAPISPSSTSTSSSAGPSTFSSSANQVIIGSATTALLLVAALAIAL